MSVVIDASYAIHISVGAAGESTVSRAISLVTEGFVAPPIFWHEVANALRNMRLRRTITDAAAGAALRSLKAMKVAVEPATPEIGSVIALSDQYNITIYDAAYLDLCLRSGLRLVTRDKGLFRAALNASVQVEGL